MDNCFPAIVGNDKLKRRLATEIREVAFRMPTFLQARMAAEK